MNLALTDFICRVEKLKWVDWDWRLSKNLSSLYVDKIHPYFIQRTSCASLFLFYFKIVAIIKIQWCVFWRGLNIENDEENSWEEV
jgi:hypothetical protein